MVLVYAITLSRGAYILVEVDSAHVSAPLRKTSIKHRPSMKKRFRFFTIINLQSTLTWSLLNMIKSRVDKLWHLFILTVNITNHNILSKRAVEPTYSLDLPPSFQQHLRRSTIQEDVQIWAFSDVRVGPKTNSKMLYLDPPSGTICESNKK